MSTMPVLQPLIDLLSNTQVMLAVITAIVDVILALVPALESVRGELIALLTGLSALLIGALHAQAITASNNAAKVQIAQTAASASVQAEQLHLESVRAQAAANKAA